MPVEFQWEDEDKTAIRYVLSGADWNWRDYHRTVQRSMFELVNIDHVVHVVADFQAVVKLPGGAIAHLRTIGKQQPQGKFSGKAIVIGLEESWRHKLLASPDADRLELPNQVIYFVATNEAAGKILEELNG